MGEIDASTAELYSWQSGLVLVRQMGSRMGDVPADVAAWLAETEHAVNATIRGRVKKL